MKHRSGHQPDPGSYARRFYTTTEAARLCNLSSSTIFRAIQNKKIKAFATPGGHFRITRTDLETFARENHIPLQGLGEKRVLLLDRDPSGRRRLQEILARDPGFEVKTAESCFEAGFLVQSLKPDLVVAVAPGNEEMEHLRLIRSDPGLSHTRIALISDSGRGGPRSLAADLRFHKSVDPQAFIDSIRELLKN